MNETTESSFTCPVCEERLDEPADKCFRCQTELDAWWPLEAAIQERPHGEPGRPGRSAQMTAAGLVSAACLGALLVFIGQAVWSPTSPEVSPKAAAPVSVEAPAPLDDSRETEEPQPPEKPAPPEVIYYQVQRGDSLWRIAAALSGRGENWELLWPEYKRKERFLQLGVVLHIPADRLRQLPELTGQGR